MNSIYTLRQSKIQFHTKNSQTSQYFIQTFALEFSVGNKFQIEFQIVLYFPFLLPFDEFIHHEDEKKFNTKH